MHHLIVLIIKIIVAIAKGSTEKVAEVDVLPAQPRAWWRPPRALADGLLRTRERSAGLVEAARQERSTRRLVPVLEERLPAEIQRLGGALARGAAGPAIELQTRRVEGAVHELARLVAERKDPRLVRQLADIDTLATACAGPALAELLEREGEEVPILSTWGDYPLAVAPDLARSGAAILYLPADFFARAAWWPAVAHEAGHVVWHGAAGFATLGRELGLGDGEPRPVRFDAQNRTTSAELDRLVGIWCEELFADVFGALMLGPAYGESMIQLFARASSRLAILGVPLTGDGRTDTHPPRHVRLLAVCRVLELVGLDGHADRLRAAWAAAHPGMDLEVLLFETDEAWVGVPLELVWQRVNALVERLVRGPIAPARGEGLADLPGLDFGPHEQREAERAKAALLAGKVPTARDVRAVVGGLVGARAEKPGREAELINLAMLAIPGLDTAERRRDRYTPAPIARNRGGFTAQEWREASVLKAILERPGKSAPR